MADDVTNLSSAFSAEAQLRKLMSAPEWAARPLVVPLGSGDIVVLERQIKALCEPKINTRVWRFYEIAVARAMSYEHLRQGIIAREKWNTFYSTVIASGSNDGAMGVSGYAEFAAKMRKPGLAPENVWMREFNEMTFMSAFSIHELDWSFGAAGLWRYLERMNEKLKSMAGKEGEDDSDILKMFRRLREAAYEEAQQANETADHSPTARAQARQADEERRQLLERIFGTRDTEQR